MAADILPAMKLPIWIPIIVVDVMVQTLPRTRKSPDAVTLVTKSEKHMLVCPGHLGEERALNNVNASTTERDSILKGKRDAELKEAFE